MKQLLVILTFVTKISIACSCVTIGNSNLEKEIASYKTIFQGTPFKIVKVKVWSDTSMSSLMYQTLPDSIKKKSTFTEWLEGNNSFYHLENQFHFKVKKIHKGKVENDSIIVQTGLGGGDCGFQFKLNEEYLIYSSTPSKRKNSPITISTNICTLTKPISSATKDLDLLKN